jgi:hypothetical protein
MFMERYKVVFVIFTLGFTMLAGIMTYVFYEISQPFIPFDFFDFGNELYFEEVYEILVRIMFYIFFIGFVLGLLSAVVIIYEVVKTLLLNLLEEDNKKYFE